MSSIFAPRPNVIQQAAPEPKSPAPMPDSDSAASREAGRRARADIMGRAGRSSTILTAPERRGGGAYTAATLGGG
jgi:hypothetical protein